MMMNVEQVGGFDWRVKGKLKVKAGISAKYKELYNACCLTASLLDHYNILNSGNDRYLAELAEAQEVQDGLVKKLRNCLI